MAWQVLCRFREDDKQTKRNLVYDVVANTIVYANDSYRPYSGEEGKFSCEYGFDFLKKNLAIEVKEKLERLIKDIPEIEVSLKRI